MRLNSITLTSLSGVNQMNRVDYRQHNTITKLSTGLRINRAADDAAGLSISRTLKAQHSSLDVAKRNIQDGISLLATAESVLDEIHNMLGRAYELSIQSSNGIYTMEDKQLMVDEVRQLKISIEDMVQQTDFNGIKLFEGDTISLQTGINAGDKLEITMPSLTHLVRHIIVKDMPADKIADTSTIQDMINRVSEARGHLGANQNRLEHVLSSNMVEHQNILSADSRISDTDMALEMAQKSKNDILLASSMSIVNNKTTYQGILDLLENR